MQDNEARPQPKLIKKLTLNRETVRVLTDKELARVEGGAGGTAACANNNNTHQCPTCGHLQSTCFPP
jgi:bacteriocin-like protein